MTPSDRWFPTSLQNRAAWFNNFYNQFQVVSTSLGFTAADVTAVENDNNMMQFIASTALAIDAYKEATRQFRIRVSEGQIGDPTPAFPANPGFVPPTAVATGIFERLDTLVKRIRVSPTYTSEIGALLGIIPASPSRPAPEAMQPELKVTTLPGSVVQVKFVRGESNGIFVETKLDNSETWSSVGIFPSSPAVIVVPQTPQNLPRSVQIRARYVEGNSPVGQFSDIVTTATQPTA